MRLSVLHSKGQYIYKRVEDFRH
uniref:Uncharacterized protein n=1 Tax=Arundo donax TaxID=35708 RepID=A0A0A9AXX1_ARUDO